MNDLCICHTVSSLLQGVCACVCACKILTVPAYCRNSLKIQLSDQECADCVAKRGRPSGTDRQDEGAAYIKLVTVDYDWTSTATQEILNKTRLPTLSQNDPKCGYQVKGKRLDTQNSSLKQRNHWHTRLV